MAQADFPGFVHCNYCGQAVPLNSAVVCACAKYSAVHDPTDFQWCSDEHMLEDHPG